MPSQAAPDPAARLKELAAEAREHRAAARTRDYIVTLERMLQISPNNASVLGALATAKASSSKHPSDRMKRFFSKLFGKSDG
jgi:hypothetical protein